MNNEMKKYNLETKTNITHPARQITYHQREPWWFVFTVTIIRYPFYMYHAMLMAQNRLVDSLVNN